MAMKTWVDPSHMPTWWYHLSYVLAGTLVALLLVAAF